MANLLGVPTLVLLAATTVMAAACSDRTAPAVPTAPQARARTGSSARADRDVPNATDEVPASIRWNQIARDYIAGLATKPGQNAAVRSFAYMSLAQYEAVLAALDSDASDIADNASGSDVRQVRPSAAAAVAGASAAVPEDAFPSGADAFESAVRAQAAAEGDSPRRQAEFSAGEAVGRAIGATIVARARTDRFNAVWTGTVPVGPGLWIGTNPILPLLGQMRPFYLDSGSQFRPPPPPAFGSPAYLTALAEVRHISDTRTPEQLAIAQKWAGNTGSLVVGIWDSITTELVTRYRLDERRAAHAYALTNTAAMDALIACHDAKYTYWFIRPFQADPAITTPIGRPNHPSYPSNHACASGTFAYVLGAFFPAERDRLAAMADEAGESRIFAGIHYRFDKNAGLHIAQQVTAVALRADRRSEGDNP